MGKSKCQVLPTPSQMGALSSEIAPHLFHRAHFESPSLKALASLVEACGHFWNQLKWQVPVRLPIPGQNSREPTQLSGLYRNMVAEKAGWDQRRRGSPGPCQQSLHCVSRLVGAGGKGETVWFPLLRQLCPHSHQWELKDETRSLPRRGDEAVTGSSGYRCPERGSHPIIWPRSSPTPDTVRWHQY